MIVIYIKHYLNKAGRDYFSHSWFPQVTSIIAKQQGFIGIDTTLDEYDEECINITVKFSNREMVTAWAETAIHQELISALAPFRTREQRWFVSDGSVPAPLNINDWTVSFTQ